MNNWDFWRLKIMQISTIFYDSYNTYIFVWSLNDQDQKMLFKAKLCCQALVVVVRNTPTILIYIWSYAQQNLF